MKHYPFPLLMAFLLVGFTSCSPSPETAAKDVCECMSKAKESPEGFLTASVECQAKGKSYADKFKDDPEKAGLYAKEVLKCTMGDLRKEIKNF